MSKTISILVAAMCVSTWGDRCGASDVLKERNISVRMEGEWIIASQGADETSQVVKVKIWGALRDKGLFLKGFYQLDSDTEEEFVIMSRNSGTGPYYKMQIIDFCQNGILTWSYYSQGKPKIEDGRVFLGSFPNGYQGAGTVAVYSPFVYSSTGLTTKEGL